MYNYKLLLDENNQEMTEVIQRTDSNGIISYIPNCAENSDWQKYQEWLALGNTPDPAE